MICFVNTISGTLSKKFLKLFVFTKSMVILKKKKDVSNKMSKTLIESLCLKKWIPKEFVRGCSQAALA